MINNNTKYINIDLENYEQLEKAKNLINELGLNYWEHSTKCSIIIIEEDDLNYGVSYEIDKLINPENYEEEN